MILIQCHCVVREVDVETVKACCTPGGGHEVASVPSDTIPFFRINRGDTTDMILLEGGTFLMGTDYEDGFVDDVGFVVVHVDVTVHNHAPPRVMPRPMMSIIFTRALLSSILRSRINPNSIRFNPISGSTTSRIASRNGSTRLGWVLSACHSKFELFVSIESVD